MLPRLEPRGAVSTPMVYLTPVLAVALTLVAGVIMFAALGFDPGRSLYVYFINPLTTVYGWSELAVKASPLALIGIGLSLGFRANVWNIGAEGPVTLGALAGGGLALWCHDRESIILLPALFSARARKSL